VIPYVAEVDSYEKRTGKEIVIKFPEVCPVCNGPLQEIGPHVVCTNSGCFAQRSGRIIAAVGRKGFNIKGLGKVLIKQLINSGEVNELPDIFTLDTNPEKMKRMGWGEKTMKKISEEIDESRLIRLDKFIFALGIPDVSIATASKLAERYESIENLIESINLDGVTGIPNTSSQTLSIIEKYFTNKDNTNLIGRFVANGVIIDKYNRSQIKSIGEKDKVVITGAFSKSRSELEEIVKRRGYKPGKDVTGNTSFVVAGNGCSERKIRVAKDLGLQILSEEEFLSRSK